MPVTVQFNCDTVDMLHAEMRRMLSSTLPSPLVPSSQTTVEVIDATGEPANDTAPAGAKAPIVLKDPEGQNYGTYDDQKVLVSDFLEMIAAAESTDDLKTLGDNNEAVAAQLTQANGRKISKAFKERRAALEAVKEPDVEPVKAEPAPAAQPDTKADAEPTVKIKVAGQEELADAPVPPVIANPTIDDLKEILGLIIGIVGLGMPAGMVLLGKHGANKLSLLPTENYAACHAAARELLLTKAGEADPLA